MKRTMAMVLALLVCVFMFAGCGGGSTALEGKYTLAAWEINGEDFLGMMKVLGGDDFDVSTLYLEFKSDGKYTLAMEDGAEGTFEVNGNVLTLTTDGESITGTVNGNKVTLESGEGDKIMKMVFEK